MAAGAGCSLIFMFASSLFTHLLPHVTRAQNPPPPITDPSQAQALNSVFREWNISAPPGEWNISGNLCSGRAVDNTPIDAAGIKYNPLIKCDCLNNNATVCHITHLKVYALDVVGVLPPELWMLTSLTYLKLGQNLLSGPLSPSIGNLTRLHSLILGINALSGELPKQLGRLSNLRILAFGTNNFSGPLPSQLGNLSMLEELYFDSSGVQGDLPTTFSNLMNLQTIWATDNELTGKIPEFIGSWSKLTALRLQGNSFAGPIPLAFSNLTAMTDLRISEVSNGGSSLAFIRSMTSLKILILRNNNISGSIPSYIGEFKELTWLDLSFNNLVGEIPESLFNLSLSYLFLGNNKLNGTILWPKLDSLLNMFKMSIPIVIQDFDSLTFDSLVVISNSLLKDLSYNALSGSFPNWINQPNLQLNLIANNFKIGSLNNSGSHSGLNCLQQKFSCKQGSGVYSDFAINCGGPQITSSSGIVYESETQIFGPVSYYVSGTDRWAVSNVGYFTGGYYPDYRGVTESQIANTNDTQIFQTQRLSGSSLRYYGLGLKNGNYTVNLQFAEIAFPNSRTWRSLGRRVFDIYIQGNLVLKDFDIRKEAGGSYRAIPKKFKVQVSENFLEIHLFWAGKGTCCIPVMGTFGPSISAISATLDAKSTVLNQPSSLDKSKTSLIVGVAAGVGSVCFLIVATVFIIVQKRKRRRAFQEELLGIDAKPLTFSYSELRGATDDFNLSNKLGEGGFGTVYKGTLNDGRVTAIKQLSVASNQGKIQFVAEIATISAVQHRNLVKLYGCCMEGDKRLLVYEYLENGSLDRALFGKKKLTLDWSKRFDICLGVARGLSYLHEESRVRIVHRDVKASNILLDGDLNPKISDFGLAKLYDDKMTHISTHVAGTIGYLAPEYAMRGHLTEKADVFGFGVVALEIVSGRPNSDPSLEEDKVFLLEWAWQLHEENREMEMVDSDLSEFSEEEVKQVIRVGLLCTQTSPARRPSMSRVVAMLCGDIEVPTVTSKPGYLTDWKFDDDTATQRRPDISQYSSSSFSIIHTDDDSSPSQSQPMLLN